MVDFALTAEQKELRANAHSFAQNVLATAPGLYSHLPTQTERFRSTLPIYQTAVKAGLIKGQIPIALGGTSAGLIDAALVVEEFHAVEPSTAVTILGTGLGLTPLILAGSKELHEKFLTPFLQQDGELLASLAHREPNGTANWLEPGAPGLQTTAYRDGDEWVINGEKVPTLHTPYLVHSNLPKSSGQLTPAAGTTAAHTSPASYAATPRPPPPHH
jgi:alkylation response protein AidB-like acyl-CoA dehydrogenase